MVRIVVTSEVEDLAAWEKAFTTHGPLLKKQGVISPCGYGYATEGNKVSLCFEVDDVDALKEALKDQSALDAMAEDGVVPGTYSLFVIDKNLEF